MKWNILVASMVLGLGLSTQSFGDLLDRMLGSNGCGCVQKDGCDQKCGDSKCDGMDGCAQKDGCGLKACEPKCGRRPLLAGCGQKCCDTKDGCKDPCGKDGAKDACQKSGCGLLGGGLLGGCAQKCGDAKGGCKDPCQKDGCKDPCSKDGGKDACQKSGCGLFNGGLLGGCAQKCGDAKGGCGDPCSKDGCKDPCAGKGSAQKCRAPSLFERIFARRHACCDSKGKGGDSKGDKALEDKLEPSADAPVPPAPVVDPSAFLKSQRQIITASASLVR